MESWSAAGPDTLFPRHVFVLGIVCFIIWRCRINTNVSLGPLSCLLYSKYSPNFTKCKVSVYWYIMFTEILWFLRAYPTRNQRLRFINTRDYSNLSVNVTITYSLQFLTNKGKLPNNLHVITVLCKQKLRKDMMLNKTLLFLPASQPLGDVINPSLSPVRLGVTDKKSDLPY